MGSLIEYKKTASNGELMFAKNSYDGRVYKLGFTEQMFGDKVELVMNGYELKEEDGKLYAVKKKPKYPKTFIEVLNFWHPDRQIEDDYQRYYKKDLIQKLQDLLYARDAYWKIAGEEMGLGKTWKPDWNNISDKHCIYVVGREMWLKDCQTRQCTLAFPTAEMRDAFYESFKELIERSKELL